MHFSRLYKEKKPQKEVILIEEHTDIGKPVQCTGILTKEIEKLIPKKDIKKVTLNEINKTEVFSPNNSVITPISKDYIICNVSFIKYLHKQAEKKGVSILQGHRYLGNTGSKIKVKNIATNKIIEFEDNFLVGADGPSSNVAKNNNLYNQKNRKFLTGVQARVKMKDFDKEKIDFYPYIGEYAWFTPESDEIARIGVAAPRNAKKIFDDFIKKYPGKILEMQGGPIPLHKPFLKIHRKEKKFSVALIGDSALQIKNTTGGGIIPGLKASVALSEGYNNYSKRLKTLNRELYAHYILNRALRNYREKDWDRLIHKTTSPAVQKILTGTNRDNALKLAIRLAMQPKMIAEGTKATLKMLNPHKDI